MTKMISAAAMLAGSTALAMPRAVTGLGIRAEASDPKTMIAALQAAEHLRHPLLLRASAHPSRKQHDDLVAVPVRADRLAPSFAATHLDLRFCHET